MIKISAVKIKRFRSIMDLHLKIDRNSNLIAICGQNNCGKTNTLRAINLFFNPDTYDLKIDMPNHKMVTKGASIHPEITLEFSKGEDVYSITRNFNQSKEMLVGKKNRIKMDVREVEKFLKEIYFFFIPSINTITPKLIGNVLEHVYDLEYNKTRFTGWKKDLKTSFETYVNGLEGILKTLSTSINPLFEHYNKDWGVEFTLPKNVDKFRDMISEDVVFDINDKSNNKVDSKGSGLQRLALILLHFKIIEKLAELKKSAILLIDEPDVYLHDGLKYQLNSDLKKNSNDAQIFITTHSSIFIDSYKLRNVFLLEKKIGGKEYKRRANETTYVIETESVNLEEEDGLRKIKNILGIQEIVAEPLEENNLIVEGECDKKYIEELCRYFDIQMFNIISANGASKIKTYLDFYNSYYEGSEKTPTIKVLFDNDNAGREEMKKINNKKYNNIIVTSYLVPNFKGEVLEEKNKPNCEIEDFVYPEIVEYLVNQILKKAGLKGFKKGDIEKAVSSKSQSNTGIMDVMNYKKNENNPEIGDKIKFSSGEGGDGIKKNIANNFKLEANMVLSKIISVQDTKHPKVKQFLVELFE